MKPRDLKQRLRSERDRKLTSEELEKALRDVMKMALGDQVGMAEGLDKAPGNEITRIAEDYEVSTCSVCHRRMVRKKNVSGTICTVCVSDML